MTDDELDVYLEGRPAGRLRRAADGRVSFSYEEGYRLSPQVTALSVSIPLHQAEHGPDLVMPWIANLLPNNERVLARWAEHFDTVDTSAFGLLRHMGADCAGAVQILPVGSTPSEAGQYEPLSEDDIADRIAALRRDDAAWNGPGANNSGSEDDDSFGRWSLGGAQGKIALARIGDEWALPTGRAASTHILKVGVQAIPDSDLAELATAAAARGLGLPVPRMEITRFGAEAALVVTRYDRLPGADGTVRRLHQEDFCQALGVWPNLRYEKETSGPTMADMAAVVADATTPGEDREASRRLLAQVVTFTLLSIGTDAHAKNHSLLHIGPRTRMAPLYDLGSAAFAYAGERLLAAAKLPLRFGRSFMLPQIDATELVRVADTLGLDRDEYLGLVRGMAADLPDALADAVHGLPVVPSSAHFAEAPGTIATLAARIMSSIDRLDPSSVEPFIAPRRY